MRPLPWSLPPPATPADVGALNEYEYLAARRLPRSIFGFVRAGVEADAAYDASLAAYRDWHLVPRILRGSAAPRIGTTLFGTHYAAPFGVAPMGGVALGRFRGDLALAEAARAEGVPFIISGAASVPMERLREAHGDAWMQIYAPGDRDRAAGLVDRIARAGYEVLVITVDVPVGSNRFHYERLGFSNPLTVTTQMVMDGLLHPRWLMSVAAQTWLRDGIPHYENNGPTRGGPLVTGSPVALSRSKLGWEDLRLIRRRFRGRIVLKGVLAPADAAIAAEEGMDGLIVSSHGGRQFDGAPAPLAMLPAIRDAAPDLAVMIDGGVRWGADVLKALALGANCVFVGRPFYFANAVAGAAGVCRAIDLLKAEIVRNMAMLGTDAIDEIGRDLLAAAASTGSR